MDTFENTENISENIPEIISKLPEETAFLNDTATGDKTDDPDSTISKEPQKAEPEIKKEIKVLQSYSNTEVVKTYIEDGTVEQNINIINSFKEERQKLIFSRISHREYSEHLSENTRGFINEAREQQLSNIQSSRILVIGYEKSTRDAAVAAMESIVFGNGNDNKAISCTIDHNDSITIHNIIEDAIKDENFRMKAEQFVVVYDETDPEAGYSTILKSILAKGSSDSISGKLRSNNLSVIYLYQNKHVFRKESGKRNKLFDLTHLQLFVYELTKEYEVAVHTYNRICEAITEFGWLKSLAEAEIKEHIHDLLEKDELENEISRIKTQETEQTQTITALLEDPLKRAVLLIACYFDTVTVKEFLEIIGMVINHESYTYYEENDKTPPLQRRWNAEADKLVGECGITVENTYTSRGRSYTFTSRFRKKRVLEVLQQRPNMLLQATEILEKIWLDHNASEHKAEGFKKLCLSSAVYDEHRYLNTVFFSLTDSLRAIDKKLKEKIIRLKNFVDEWEACEAFRETLNKCFEEMTRTKTRRNIYSILLMHNCTPEKPEYMGRVKNLLESVLPQELVITCDMLEQIVLNYIDCLDVFLRTVHEWRTDDSNTDSPENYVRYAMLFAFNANTAQQPSQNEFGYRVLEKITAPGSLLKLSDLMIFLFSDKGKADFINTLKKSKKTVTDDEIIEDIDRVFALVFVKWLEILVLIRKNTPEADWNAHELIAGAIKTAQDQIPVKPVRKAVTNLRTFYNALIMGQPITTPEEKFYKEVLIAKRNYANDILEIINQNN